jgi:predicted ester cyclase
MANFFDAFPNAAYTLNDLFFAGDKGVWRGTWDATQRKDWEGIPATGREAKWTVIIIGRFEGDKLVAVIQIDEGVETRVWNWMPQAQ